MKNETIRNLQREIEEKYPMRTLHILNGQCMLDYFQKDHLMSEKAVLFHLMKPCAGGKQRKKYSLQNLLKKELVLSKVHQKNIKKL